jgi:hypothetical protein
MQMKSRIARSVALAWSVLSLVAALRGAAADKEPVDRGPTCSGTIRSTFPGENFAMKGIVVTIGDDTNAFVCYDTDLMRVSVAWTGDYLKFGNYMKEIVHPQPPQVAGTPVFGTKPGPGWAKAGRFTDPRPNQQGPLPRDWAKYRGLYLYERKVVFSYTVGQSEMLELPGLETIDGLKVFTRTFEIKRPTTQTLLICDAPEGTAKAQSNPTVLIVPDLQSRDGATSLAVALVGAPFATLEQAEGRVVARLSGKEKGPLQIALMRGTQEEVGRFQTFVQRERNLPQVAALVKGGPGLWKEPVLTRGALGTNSGPYVVDTITEPVPNPWQANTFFGGFDFFPDGRAAICTFHGDVWIVSGIDDKLDKLLWRRFATGLFQPLGLKIVDRKVYVLGRDQITRLHDLNSDGEADFYENFNNDTVVTPNYHEFCLDLQTDSKGDFFFFKSSPWQPHVTSPHQGTLLKVSQDGSELEVFATGFRAPNGSAIGPHDEITVSDNQGHWMPASKLNLVTKGGFYGMMPAAQREMTLQRGRTNLVMNPSDPRSRASLKVAPFDGSAPIPVSYDEPICWLPMNMDNSSGGQVWVRGTKWGPFKDHLLFMSYGHCALFSVMLEEVDGVTQAGMARFPFKFPTGVMRGRSNPRDGQIYVCGLRGWQTDGTKEGGFYRVRYTGQPVYMPAALHASKDGLKIVFTSELDRASATDLANYSIEQWNYSYSGAYGSSDFSVTDPKVKRHDKVQIKSARLGKDAKTIRLEVAGLQPVDQMKIKMTLKAADGSPVTQEIYSTIHKVATSSLTTVNAAPR